MTLAYPELLAWRRVGPPREPATWTEAQWSRWAAKEYARLVRMGVERPPWIRATGPGIRAAWDGLCIIHRRLTAAILAAMALERGYPAQSERWDRAYQLLDGPEAVPGDPYLDNLWARLEASERGARLFDSLRS